MDEASIEAQILVVAVSWWIPALEISLSLKNLANPTSVLENSYSSRDALLEDTYGGKQKPFIGNGTQEKIRP